MAISLCLTPFTSHAQTRIKVPIFKSINVPIISIKPKISRQGISPRIKCVNNGSSDQLPASLSATKPRWENLLSTAASLYPVYVTVGGIIACLQPSTFSWFVDKGPASYSLTLGFIMLAMGLTLELKDLINLFMERPLSILFGCVAQYTIMPAFGYIISKYLGLPPAISVGLILLSCCPGGTASNVCFR